jgi:hypothetical protein
MHPVPPISQDRVERPDETSYLEWFTSGSSINRRIDEVFKKLSNPATPGSAVSVLPMGQSILALQAGGTGDISTQHLAWAYDAGGGPDFPSAITDGTYFYMSDDKGLVSNLDARTGEKV